MAVTLSHTVCLLAIIVAASSRKLMYNISTGFCGFQPKKKGLYVVDVTQDGAKFPGSPFQIQIGDAEVCSPKKVKVSGAVREGMTQQWNDIVINVSEAGKMNLTRQHLHPIICRWVNLFVQGHGLR